MLAHALAILGIIAGAVAWWALQRATGGERLGRCKPDEGGCGSCASRTDACGDGHGHPDSPTAGGPPGAAGRAYTSVSP